jgi:hypothetical protein
MSHITNAFAIACYACSAAIFGTFSTTEAKIESVTRTRRLACWGFACGVSFPFERGVIIANRSVRVTLRAKFTRRTYRS